MSGGHGHDDFAFEPIRGLPERPPEGEKILWQGAPTWKGLAIRSFHVRKVAIYFAILMVWRLIETLHGGGTLAAALVDASGILPVAVVGIGLLAGFAYLYARSSVFTVTSRRVVMRFGLALPMAINLPFARIDAAAHRRFADGSGDIPLTLAKGERIAFLHLWPFARPWKVSQPQPTLKALAESEKAAQILGEALEAFLAEGGDEAAAPSIPVRLARPGATGVRAAAPAPGRAKQGASDAGRAPAVASPSRA
ncbi:MAG: photosynthetic complex putative assembly protein PuhB [Alphaproteobacteria bacterium]|nr:photosynthetic complex putative assembly protein PuhB [Alphaproteobacteria bacterium]